MQSVYRLIILVFASALLSSCQRELSYIGSGDPGQVALPSPLKAHLQGNVLDENGQPAPNVTVRVGSEITLTDAKGYFRINDAPLDKNAALVTVEKSGYFKTFRSFSAAPGTNQVVIKLVRKHLSGTVSGTNGGEVSFSNGAKISLPANGTVKASDNSNYTGTVNVYAAYIDPTAPDILESVPGSFMANDKEGKRVLLSSYGMMAVELESSTGEKLQVKPGSKATLTSPIPAAAQSSAPATIPLWYVDESTGLWKEEGTATRQGSNYLGEVEHFTYWNCDIPVQTIMLTGTFKTADGQPLVNAEIVIKPASGEYFGAAHGYTDSLGQMNGPVPFNMNLVLQVMDGCRGVVYSKNIGPFNGNSNLGVITVPSAMPGLVTVKGKLESCAGTNVTNGYAIVSVNNLVRYAKVDANGNFSTNYVLCNINGVNVQALGVDETAQQQGNVSSRSITSPVTDIGTISACGTVSIESLDYTLDGKNYHLGAADSLLSYSVDSAGTSQDFTYVMGAKAPDFIQFQINTTTQTPGSYRLNALYVQNYFQTTVIQPLNVTLTSFAKAPGQFYEGSFTGQFRDGANVTHTISCTFRVRRTF